MNKYIGIFNANFTLFYDFTNLNLVNIEKVGMNHDILEIDYNSRFLYNCRNSSV